MIMRPVIFPWASPIPFDNALYLYFDFDAVGVLAGFLVIHYWRIRLFADINDSRFPKV